MAESQVRSVVPEGYATVAEASQSISDYLDCFNQERRHQSLVRQTPDQVHYQSADQRMAAYPGNAVNDLSKTRGPFLSPDIEPDYRLEGRVLLAGIGHARRKHGLFGSMSEPNRAIVC